jgi:curved DNA-binding protein CbpA
MIFDTNLTNAGTYYDVLDIAPSASPNEVREAYLRAKSAYNKDSVAVYSLIDAGERDDILRRIEEAYEILSNSEKRRQYDSHHGIIESTGVLDSKVISIDRVPPMETLASGDDPLVAPKTDFAEVTPNPMPSSIAKSAEYLLEQGQTKRPAPMASDIEIEILGETQWSGAFIRRVRDAQNISIEEMSNVTKISKTYINAIEQEDFKKLPALVFMRGFLVQVCRMLKLPQDKVLDAYLQRFKAAKTENS